MVVKKKTKRGVSLTPPKSFQVTQKCLNGLRKTTSSTCWSPMWSCRWMTMASDHDAATTGLESADYLCAGEPELDTLRARTPTLASKIRPIAVTRCWEWIGARDPRGYGNVRGDGGVRKAHLVVYEALRGPIPTGLECDHRCR